MNIQKVNQPSFGKLYMPQYKTLAKKYGTQVAKDLEAQRPAAEKAAKDWDVYLTNAWFVNNHSCADFKILPLGSGSYPNKEILDNKWSCMTRANGLAQSISEIIEEKNISLHFEGIVEKNLATNEENFAFLHGYSTFSDTILDAIINAQYSQNRNERKNIDKFLNSLMKVLDKNGLVDPNMDKLDNCLNTRSLYERILKANVPLKTLREDLATIGIDIPSSN